MFEFVICVQAVLRQIVYIPAKLMTKHNLFFHFSAYPTKFLGFLLELFQRQTLKY